MNRVIRSFFPWHSVVVLETPFSVSYCFNRFKKGLEVENNQRWKRPYSIHITDIDVAANTCRVLIRGSMGIPAVDVLIQLHPVGKRSTRLELEFETTPTSRRLRYLVEIPVLVMSLLAFPCALLVFPFYFFTKADGMKKMNTILIDALEQSLGVISVKNKNSFES
ncbi:hypothetical protein [Aggregatilinea lenta]|uniref:hypothetical protein n=1 Tax=Aggregatilinea lenta TaxID=913108 RepID=UPI000E5B046A|nr:hypothetical protein [Aggregatilinea lenta]